MHKSWLVLLAGFAITWFMLGESRRRGDRGQLKQQVHTWEDEGGNVPDVQTVGPNADAPPKQLKISTG
jgi:hypothetical protein